jgi:hypothetical protein
LGVLRRRVWQFVIDVPENFVTFILRVVQEDWASLHLETARFVKTAVNNYRPARRYIAEDFNPHQKRCENLTDL